MKILSHVKSKGALLLSGALLLLGATTAAAQRPTDKCRPASVIPLASEPPPKIFIDPPRLLKPRLTATPPMNDRRDNVLIPASFATAIFIVAIVMLTVSINVLHAPVFRVVTADSLRFVIFHSDLLDAERLLH